MTAAVENSHVEAVLDAVANRSGFDRGALLGRNRSHALSWWRQVSMVAIQKATHPAPLSPAQIGEIFDGRDRTAVTYALDRGEGDERMFALALEIAEEIR